MDDEHLHVLKERRDWLRERIKAKTKIGWETQWDKREYHALNWAVKELNRRAKCQDVLVGAKPVTKKSNTNNSGK